jgi:hypothetical protein
MARLRLDIRADWTIPIRHSGVAQTVPIPCYHPYVWLHLVRPGEEQSWRPPKRQGGVRLFEAVVDTGASLTNLPFHVWAAAEAEIRWLNREDTDSIAIGGREHDFRLGRVLLAASDEKGRWMPPAWTLARCLAETEDPIPALLGLMSPFLMSGRRIRHAESPADRPEWWLEGG